MDIMQDALFWSSNGQELIDNLRAEVKRDVADGWTLTSSAMKLKDLELALDRLEFLERRSTAEFNAIADALGWARRFSEFDKLLPGCRDVVLQAILKIHSLYEERSKPFRILNSDIPMNGNKS